VTAPRRQRALLAVLGVLALILAGRWLWPRLYGPDAGGAGGRHLRAERLAGHVVEDLRLADLDARPATYESGRDPFRYGEPPPPPGPTPEQLAEAARLRAEAELARRLALEQQQALAAIPPAPQPPEIALRYLGSISQLELKIAVFSDAKTIYNALEGDVLEGKFIVDSIGFESVDIKFVGFPDVPARRLPVGF
jgi:hypothetical protein